MFLLQRVGAGSPFILEKTFPPEILQLCLNVTCQPVLNDIAVHCLILCGGHDAKMVFMIPTSWCMCLPELWKWWISLPWLGCSIAQRILTEGRLSGWTWPLHVSPLNLSLTSQRQKKKKLHSSTELLLLTFFFFSPPCSLWDLSSQTRDRTSFPLHWELRVLTAALQGNFLLLILKKQLPGCEWDYVAGDGEWLLGADDSLGRRTVRKHWSECYKWNELSLVSLQPEWA